MYHEAGHIGSKEVVCDRTITSSVTIQNLRVQIRELKVRMSTSVESAQKQQFIQAGLTDHVDPYPAFDQMKLGAAVVGQTRVSLLWLRAKVLSPWQVPMELALV